MTVAAGTVFIKIIYKGLNFVDRIIDNEKVASSKKCTKFKTRVQKVYYHFRIKTTKIDTPFMTKKAEKTYFLGPHIPVEHMHVHIWVYPHWD